MKDLLLFVLMTLGIIYTVTQSRIGALVRRPWRYIWGKYEGAAAFVYCPACFGFWVGLGLARYFSYPFLVAAFSACALGALWSEYGSSADPWDAEAYDKTEKA